MENKATIKTAIPTTSGFRNFAFCTSIFALPNPLSCPTYHAFMSQLCKTKPIFTITKLMHPSLPQRFMKTNQPRPARKNKPNQTQSRRAESPPRYAIRNTQYEIRDTNPIPPPNLLSQASAI